MAGYFYLVFTRPKPGQDEAFNNWYSKRHIYDLVAIPGITAARRYRLLDPASNATTPDYLAVYEFHDLDLAIGGIAERRGTDRMPSTEAIDRDASRGVVVKPLWNPSAEWVFDRGLLDLIKGGAAADLRSVSVEGFFAANEKQSRPGPPVFDLAFFDRNPKAAPPPAIETLARTAASRMTAIMDPITERVRAS